jgi:hypothetical protein
MILVGVILETEWCSLTFWKHKINENINMNMCHKKSLKIPNGYSEAVNGRTNNAMGKRKG